MTIGEVGSGRFTQFNGTNAIIGDLSVGTGAGRGIYNLSAGSLQDFR
ncbi:MAG: hypothetical protein ABSA09_11790 [Desulfobaccales bacterium]|jgi:hypothetical protein